MASVRDMNPFDAWKGCERAALIIVGVVLLLAVAIGCWVLHG